MLGDQTTGKTPVSEQPDVADTVRKLQSLACAEVNETEDLLLAAIAVIHRLSAEKVAAEAQLTEAVELLPRLIEIAGRNESDPAIDCAKRFLSALGGERL